MPSTKLIAQVRYNDGFTQYVVSLQDFDNSNHLDQRFVTRDSKVFLSTMSVNLS